MTCDVMQVFDGEEGLCEGSGVYDLIYDLMLPEKDGFQVLKDFARAL